MRVRYAAVSLCLIAVTVAAACAASSAPPTTFKLELKLAKTVFQVGEPMPFGAVLTNVSGSLAEMTAMGGDRPFAVWLEVTDQCGHGIPPRRLTQISFSIGYSMHHMKPGESLTAKGEVGKIGGANFAERYPIEKPGLYCARAVARPGGFRFSCKDEYTSEWVELVVVQTRSGLCR